ncbi:hypothetical protein MCEMOH36_00881 [Candidatus Methylopumilus universalis]
MKFSKLMLEIKANNFNLIRLIAAFAFIYGYSKAITQSGPNDFFRFRRV